MTDATPPGWPQNLGWQCPCCGRVFSPEILMCPRCGQDDVFYTQTTDDAPDVFVMDNLSDIVGRSTCEEPGDEQPEVD